MKQFDEEALREYFMTDHVNFECGYTPLDLMNIGARWQFTQSREMYFRNLKMTEVISMYTDTLKAFSKDHVRGGYAKKVIAEGLRILGETDEL